MILNTHFQGSFSEFHNNNHSHHKCVCRDCVLARDQQSRRVFGQFPHDFRVTKHPSPPRIQQDVNIALVRITRTFQQARGVLFREVGKLRGERDKY